MQTLSHSNAVPTKPGRNLATVAVVAGLHLAVLYAILASVDMVPSVFPKPPTDFRVIDEQQKHVVPTPPDIHIQTRIKTDDVTPPVLRIDHSADVGNGLTQVTHTSGTVTMASQTPFVPAVAVQDTHTIPAYPPFDRRLGHEGAVRLRLSIDQAGVVTDAVVEHSSGYQGLDEAAVAWVKTRWRYQPAKQDGKPVPASAAAMVTFRLTQG